MAYIRLKYFGQLLVEIAQLENLLAHEENKIEMLETLTLGLHIENTRYFLVNLSKELVIFVLRSA